MPDLLDRLKTALADRYAIEREIGAGGMATVYLARDLKHDRQVAVKVLRPDLAATVGPERFLREIQIAAKLHHPHILPLYDSGEAEGFLYYVMPYEEGQSLRDKLTKEGELPIHDAVRLLRDVVDALAHAHGNGVVHRDIKPDNVLLSDRHAMVTDFGVAKAVSDATGREKLTTAGIALGTPAYMAPEQAAASPQIDHRADIYAVGALAYELLTGRPPFTGATPQVVLSAHVTEAPDPVTKHRQTVPVALSNLVMKCLEKKPADRWQNAEDLLGQLEALATPSLGITPTDTRPIVATVRKERAVRLVRIAGAVVVVGAVGVLLMRGDGSDIVRVGETQQITRSPGLELDPALSPDGNMVAYAAGRIGEMQLFVRQRAGGRDIQLTEGFPGHHRWPKWSPDGTRIAFMTLDNLPLRWSVNVVPALGGIPTPLVEGDGHIVSPAWSPDGTRIAYVSWGEGSSSIYTRAAAGGEPTLIAQATEVHGLSWSPDGSRIAYVSGASSYVLGVNLFGNIRPSSLWVVSAEGGDPVRVTEDDNLDLSPTWTPDGRHLFFVSNRGGTRDIYRVRLRASGEPAGEPQRVTIGIHAHTLSISNDGRSLAYSVLTFRSNIWSLPIPTGGPVSSSQAEPVTTDQQVIEGLSVTPDGRWLVFDSNRNGNQDIYKMPVEGGEVQQLTTDPSHDFAPMWSDDGEQIVFHSLRTGSRDVYVVSADGGSIQQVTSYSGNEMYPDWSPGRDRIVFRSSGNAVNGIRVILRDPNDGSWTEDRQLVERGRVPRWSPDGNSIAYQDGTTLAVVSADTGEPRMRLEVGTRMYVAWSSDGRTLYYKIFDYAAGLPGWPSIWSVPAEGGPPRQLVRFDDPTRPSRRSEFDTDGKTLFFTVNEDESDIAVMELLNN